MPQTMLALLALSMAALLAFSQQRVTIQSYEVRLRDEYSVAAAGLLTEIMELNAARSFDEASHPDRIFQVQRLPTVDEFTPSEHFGRYSPLPGQGRGLQKGIQKNRDENFKCDLLQPSATPLCNDVDDVDNLKDVPVQVMLDAGRALNFEISASVWYVDDFNTSQIVNYQTHSKLVILRARTPDMPRLGEIARIERVVSYDPLKAMAEFEAVYGPLTEIGDEYL